MAMRSLKIDFYLYRVLILVETRVKFVRVVEDHAKTKRAGLKKMTGMT